MSFKPVSTQARIRWIHISTNTNHMLHYSATGSEDLSRTLELNLKNLLMDHYLVESGSLFKYVYVYVYIQVCAYVYISNQ